jgi:hypothetical protein
MMIDDDALKQLLRINDELFAAMQVSERKARHGDFIPAYTAGGRPNAYSNRSGQEQIALMMEPYKGYFIDGSALIVHPFSPDWYVGGNVYVSGHSGSIVGIARFQIQQFTVSIKELAEWFGLRLPGLWWTNACLRDRMNDEVPPTLLPQV